MDGRATGPRGGSPPLKKRPRRFSWARTRSIGRASSPRCGARFRVGLPLPVIGIVDVALWDLVARSEDLSIADMLGRGRDRIRGCASAPPVETAQDCEAMVNELLDVGFRAIKLHVCGDLDTDIAVCRAARREGGDDIDLMMDAMGLYDRHGARSAWLHTRRTRLPLVRGSALGRGPGRLEGVEAPA